MKRHPLKHYLCQCCEDLDKIEKKLKTLANYNLRRHKEICYDEFAYKRVVNSFKEAIKSILKGAAY